MNKAAARSSRGSRRVERSSEGHLGGAVLELHSVRSITTPESVAHYQPFEHFSVRGCGSNFPRAPPPIRLVAPSREQGLAFPETLA